MLQRDVQQGEEITVNYGWEHNGANFVQVCRCQSANCGLFMEEDAVEQLNKILSATRVVTSLNSIAASKFQHLTGKFNVRNIFHVLKHNFRLHQEKA